MASPPRLRTVGNHPLARLFAVAVLLAIMFGLLVWFASLPPAPEAGDYPGPYHLSVNYEEYVGERASMAAYVVQVDPVVLDAGSRNGLRLELLEAPPDLSEGQRLRVFGIVETGHRMRHVNSFVVPRSGLVYAYVSSFFAGLWALYRLLKHWRFDRDGLGLVPRTNGSIGSHESTAEVTDDA